MLYQYLAFYQDFSARLGTSLSGGRADDVVAVVEQSTWYQTTIPYHHYIFYPHTILTPDTPALLDQMVNAMLDLDIVAFHQNINI